MKTRVCKWCKTKFTPERPKQICCCAECALSYGQKQSAKAERIADLAARKTIKIKLDAIKPRSALMREAQAAINAYVRERDKDLPCISCGRHHEGQWHAGHYRSAGSAPHLRLDAERNIHKQCAPCNTHLSGNLINYRHGLIARKGIEMVEELEADQEQRKYSNDELRAIKAYYVAKLKGLRTDSPTGAVQIPL